MALTRTTLGPLLGLTLLLAAGARPVTAGTPVGGATGTQAGGVASPQTGAASFAPQTGGTLGPQTGGTSVRVATPPLLRWRNVSRARYYNLQLFRHGHKVLSTWPVGPRLHVPSSWRFGGHRYRLTRGHYRWYVWPGFGRRADRHYGRLIRTATFYYKR